MTADPVPAPGARDSTPVARYTLVAFHAHPDDEALFTGGTIARLAADGHRVVVVTATAGELGLTGTAQPALGEVRQAELAAAVRELGAARLVLLGYGDSGMGPGPPPAGSFCVAPVGEAAARLAGILLEEHADALTIYDPHGGYGHRDHVRVHDVGVAAAAQAGTRLVFEATVARESLQRGVRLANRLGIRPGGIRSADLASSYRPRSQITHEVDVRRFVAAKQRALAAHASQTGGGADVRTVALLSRLPRPLARRVLGREWFVEHGRSPSRHPLNDLWASLR